MFIKSRDQTARPTFMLSFSQWKIRTKRKKPARTNLVSDNMTTQSDR